MRVIKMIRKKDMRRLLIGAVLLAMVAGVTAACGHASAADTAAPATETTAPQSETTKAAATENTDNGAVAPLSDADVIKFDSFATEDLDGNEVTEDIFKDHDYTMVNFWGTYCGQCIVEMPDIEKISQNLPENLQIIGIVIDYPYGEDNEYIKNAADTIVEETGVTYRNLRAWQQGYEVLSALSYAIPTTVFVDSTGTVVGDAIIGNYVESYKDRLAELSKEG